MVAAVVAVALVALGIAAIVRGNGGGDKTVQTVAGHKITEKNLEPAVEHFHQEPSARASRSRPREAGSTRLRARGRVAVNQQSPVGL